MQIGIDIVEVSRIAKLIKSKQFLKRVFTAQEISYCSAKKNKAQHFAVRFAAKEAVVKVLRPVEVQPDWRSIEIHRMTGGWCEIRLSGQAAELAAEAGIGELTVSLSHEASVAGAVVVGRCTQREWGI